MRQAAAECRPGTGREQGDAPGKQGFEVSSFGLRLSQVQRQCSRVHGEDKWTGAPLPSASNQDGLADLLRSRFKQRTLTVCRPDLNRC